MLSGSTLSEHCPYISMWQTQCEDYRRTWKRSNKVLDQESNSCLVQKDSKQGWTCV